MKRRLLALLVCSFAIASVAFTAEPLRVFIRAGEKTHGPNQHDHPRFLAEWTKLLNERGAKASGAMGFPTAEQLEQTDVLILFAADAGMVKPEQRGYLDKFLARGGGMVVLHDAVCGSEADWFKTVIGGAWQHGRASWFEGEISMYFVDQEHPITRDASNFDLDDELYYQLDFMPEVRVLAATWTPDKRANKNGRAFPHIYNTAPQMWTYEKVADGAPAGAPTHRAFVSILGHNYKTFDLPNYRAILMRGIAWAGKRENVDELASKEELASLKYPPGGPTRPAEALAKLSVHPDFKMSLVAAEPLINKAMNIDWDPAGRMWVAETPEYPNGRRGLRPDYEGKEWKDHGGIDRTPGVQQRLAKDRISILTDTDGDGVMDKKDVFYEGLELATGFVFHKDGVIVTQAPDILFVRDTNGDGKADKVEKLYTGLGTMDTHAVINNPRWGYDGWIYATHGYSGTQHAMSGDGKKDFGPINSGVVRFKPDGSAIEQYSSKGGNTWGLAITWDNEVVWTQPTSGTICLHTVLSEAQLAKGKIEKTPSFNVVIASPKSYPAMTWEQQAYRQIDLVGSFTAAAGTVIYDGGAWPSEYNGDYFTTEPTINILHHERLSRNGPSYVGKKLPGREETEFVTAKDLWFRPIEVRVGPDGAMYVVDFYNQAVIHNDTRGPDHNKVNAAVRPDRDHYFGRIWRVDHKQAKKLPFGMTAKHEPGIWIKALGSENQAQRMTALRMLVENGAGDQLPALKGVAAQKDLPAAGRIAGLWALARLGKLDDGELLAAMNDKDPAVAKNGLRLVAAQGAGGDGAAMVAAARLSEPNQQVRLAAILALGASKPTDATIAALLKAWPTFSDPWMQSAGIAAANGAPAEFLIAALGAADPEPLKPLLAQLAAKVRDNADATARVVIALAGKEGNVTMKVNILTALAQDAGKRPAPPWTPELQAALAKLLDSSASAGALPLASAWDKGGALAPQIKTLSGKLLATLKDAKAPDEKRGAAIATLLAMKAEVKGSVAAVLASEAGNGLKKQALDALGETTDADTGGILVKAFAQLEPALQNVALTHLLKRPEWTRALIAGITDQTVSIATLGPLGLDRLRNHPDKAVAREALTAIEAVRGPQMAEKNKVIAALLPQIETGGDAAGGHATFTAACAVCHKFNNEGANVAPPLDGMGAHPRAELITHIVDPNREVEPNYAAWMAEMKDGTAYVGIIASENAGSVTIRDQAAEHELKRSDVKTLAPMNRSLMPEGFEALGPEPLRDLLAYLESTGAGRFRVLDLGKAVTADGRVGLFNAKEELGEGLELTRHGHVQLGEVPFMVINPSTRADGRNLIVLKGGPAQSFAQTYPAKVEIPVGKVRATALHFLGGIGAWAFPFDGDRLRDLPAAKVTVVYEGGKTEELLFKNAVEFADYIGPNDVPGSALVPKLTKGHQVRVFRKPLAIGGVIEQLIIESGNNMIAPVFVAITAEAGEKGAPAPSYGPEIQPPAPAEPAKTAAVQAAPAASKAESPLPPADATKGVRALAVGGGSSHDFQKWFNEADRKTLSGMGAAWYEYTEDTATIAKAAPNLELLYLSANQPLAPESRKAVMDMANAGRGLLLVHPALWYNWNDFPEYNRELVGGGARAHDKYGEFEVEVLDPDHPLMVGLPKKFKITDELYQFVPDTSATQIQVLAQATSPVSGKTYPQVWITRHPKARIACISLGHDGKAHESEPYQTLLRNAFKWAAGK